MFVPFAYEDKGRGDYHIAEFTEPVKTDQLRLSVPSELNRPFSFALREEISSQNFYKVVRSKGELYVWVNNKLIFEAADPFADQPAKVGLYSDGIQTTYNAFTGFDVSGHLFDAGTPVDNGDNGDDEDNGDDGNNGGDDDQSGETPVDDGNQSGDGDSDGGSDESTNGNVNSSKEQQADVSPNANQRLELEGGVTLDIPAGAVSSKGTIRIAVVDSDQVPAHGDKHAVSQVFELSSTTGDRFSKPLKLSFVYDDEQLQPGSKPAVYYYHEGQKRWIFVGGTMGEDRTINVEVNHFTTFAVYSYEPQTMTDMTNHWAERYVSRLAGMDVASGYPDGGFHPGAAISRYEFAKLLALALGLKAASSDMSFADDTNIPSWAKPYVAAAVEAGLIQGYAEGGATSFHGELTVTRAEAAVMTARTLQLYDTAADGITDGAPILKDASDIPSWARPSIDEALSAGILSGYDDGSFRADQTATRAEAATMIYKLLFALGI